ncbi:MAG: hypothetical protein SGPRY_008290, partial [Prymnesium sp.]
SCDVDSSLLQERLMEEAEESERMKAEREDELMLQRIEEELKKLNSEQVRRGRAGTRGAPS